MVLLTDLPLIEAADLISASTAFAQRPVDKGCVWPLVNGVPAHPVMLTAAMALELSAQPEARLRDWRMEYPERFHVWATPNAHFVRDIDEPASLVQLRQDTGLDWQLAPRVRAQGLISR
jgi:CTP:molybdopterin cytidylyltransferase MocA